MGSSLITYSSHSCCSILPYPNEFELVLCETSTEQSRSLAESTDWKSCQSRRFLQESKFPLLFSAKTNLSFLSTSSHHRWFSLTYPHPDSPITLHLSFFSIFDRGVDTFFREFHNGFGGVRVGDERAVMSAGLNRLRFDRRTVRCLLPGHVYPLLFVLHN